MLRSKSELDTLLTKTINDRRFDEIADKVADHMNKNHNIPTGIVMDYITTRNPMQESDEFFEYCMLEAIADNTSGIQQESFLNRIAAYYSEIERQNYQKKKLPTKELKFPIKIPCFRVADDQWIGVTDINFIMLLRQSQLIRYNENAQRVMKRIIRKDHSVGYSISINWGAVKEIEDCYKENRFIPNTWTFNIPFEVDVDYEFDDTRDLLIFNRLQCLDIIDGYHRYLAACRTYDENPDFNLPIELRITSFSEDRARDFIAQEDHKTKMLKIDAMSMDKNTPGNFVVDQLNKINPNMEGKINRNGGIINYSQLASCFTRYYFDGKTKLPRSEYADKIRYISTYYDKLIIMNPSVMDGPWTFEMMLASVILYKYIENTEPDIPKKVSLYDIWQQLSDRIPAIIPRKELTGTVPIKKAEIALLYKELDKIIGIS